MPIKNDTIHTDVPSFKYIAIIDPPENPFDIYVKNCYADHLDITPDYKRTNNRLINIRLLYKHIVENNIKDVLILMSNKNKFEDIQKYLQSIPESCFLFIVSAPLGHKVEKKSNFKLQLTPPLKDRDFILKCGTHFQYLLKHFPSYEFASLPFPENIGKIESLCDILKMEKNRFAFYYDDYGFRFDMICNIKRNTDALVVVMQSAVDRAKSEIPIFQRWKWADDFNASILVLNDPMLYLDKAMNGGWMMGNKEVDLIEICVNQIRKLIEQLNISTEKVIFYGGSAGGFTALMMATVLKGSKAIVDIPQIDLERYNHLKQIEYAFNKGFGTNSFSILKNLYKYRINVIERCKKYNNIPDFIYLINMNDTHHIEEHFLPFFDFVNTQKNKVSYSVFTYNIWHMQRGGHFPLGRLPTTKIINNAITCDFKDIDVNDSVLLKIF